jgi:hypothetical protein
MKISEFIDAEIKKSEDPSEELHTITRKVKKEFNTDCVLKYIGGFDSPGYDINCYAFAYVEDGELKIHGYNHEFY